MQTVDLVSGGLARAPSNRIWNASWSWDWVWGRRELVAWEGRVFFPAQKNTRLLNC